MSEIKAIKIGGENSFSVYIKPKDKWLRVWEAKEVKDPKILKMLEEMK